MNWIKSVVNTVWGAIKAVMPDRIKALVVKFLTKNQKVLLVLQPAMNIVKMLAMAYGKPEVAAIIAAIQRTLEAWGISLDPSKLPPTIAVALAKQGQATLDEAKVALRDAAKLLLAKQEQTFATLSESEKNLAVEMAYNMVKDEIAGLKPSTEEINA